MFKRNREPLPAVPAKITEQAAAWVARCDRGFSAVEQDAFLQWQAADPRHAEAVAQHAAAFERMMKLYEWQPGQSAEPNPDLFAPRRRWPVLSGGLAAAAVIAISSGVWWRSAIPETPAPQSTYLRVNERHALPDGSVVELKDGSRIAMEFSDAERRVTLIGEGHFTVASEAARPFVVDAAGVAVRAIGTAFNVRVDAEAVEVLVTEGRVRVENGDTADAAAPLVRAQQRVVVNRATTAALEVVDVSGAEMADALAWQAPRLQFFETPLGVAAEEFNQRNRTQLVFADAELKTIPIGGTFRVDNLEGFVRLLEVTLEVRSERRDTGEIVLTRAR